MIIDTIETENTIINITDDEGFPENPRDWDNLGTMCCFHGRYDVPNETNYSEEDFESWDEMERTIWKDQNPAVVLRVFAYDHSCFDIATEIKPYWWHYSWDGGMIGFIFVSREKIKKEYGYKRLTKKIINKISQYLSNEVEIYSNYVNGQVFGYLVECKNCGETIDQMAGFYGSDLENNGLLEEARNAECQDCLAKQERVYLSYVEIGE